MRSPFRVFVCLVLTLGVGFVSADVNRWNALYSAGYNQTQNLVQCENQPACEDDRFWPGGTNGSASCSSGSCWIFSGVFYGTDVVRIVGEGSNGAILGGDVIPYSASDVYVVRGENDVLEISYDLDAGEVYSSPQTPTLEVAVFRYDGDPSVFDGLSAPSLQTLFDLGIVTSNDVLFSDFLSTVDQREVTIDVAGIPESELVVFATGRSLVLPPVEAIPVASPVWMIAFGLVLLAVGARIFRIV